MFEPGERIFWLTAKLVLRVGTSMVTTDRVDVMIEPDFLRFDTLSLHAGQQPDPTTGARAVPLYFTTSHVFDDSDHAAGLFNLEMPGHLYSRLPTRRSPCSKSVSRARRWGRGGLHGERSGSLLLGVVTLMGQGGHIVASRNIYGGTHQMLNVTLPRLGITTTFVDPRDPQAFEDAITDETRLVFAETLGNPGVEVLDIPAVAEVAHRHGLPLMVDSTFTPYCIRPIEHGADIVMHSVTKFLGGHGVALGGALVDGGRFDWEASGRFDTMTEPMSAITASPSPTSSVRRPSSPARAEGLRDFGAAMSPANAFQLLQGVETLRCAWRDTSRMPEPSPRCSRRTMPWPG